MKSDWLNVTKTAQAREAYNLYQQKNPVRLIFHAIKLFLYIAVPATVIAYLTDHVSGLFYILAPFFIYLSFPFWFGLYVSGALLTQMAGESFGKKTLFGDNPSFPDVTFHLTGFRVKDESNKS